MFSYLENKEIDGKYINTDTIEKLAKQEVASQMETCIDIVLSGSEITDKKPNKSDELNNIEKEKIVVEDKLNKISLVKSTNGGNDDKDRKDEKDKKKTDKKTRSSDSTEADEYFLFWH